MALCFSAGHDRKEIHKRFWMGKYWLWENIWAPVMRNTSSVQEIMVKWTQKYHPCFALDPNPTDGQLLIYMVWCCLLSSKCSGLVGSGGLWWTSTVVWILSCALLKWSDVMFAQVCGSKAERPKLLYPSGGPSSPLAGKHHVATHSVPT